MFQFGETSTQQWKQRAPCPSVVRLQCCPRVPVGDVISITNYLRERGVLWLTAEVSKIRAPDFLGRDLRPQGPRECSLWDMEGSWDKAEFAGLDHESPHWVITHPVLHYTMFIPFCHWWVWLYKVVSFPSSVLAGLEEGTGRAVCLDKESNSS